MKWRSAIWNLVAIAVGAASGYGVGVTSSSLLQGVISGIVVGGMVWLAFRWYPNARRASAESSTGPTESPAVADAPEEGAESTRDVAEKQMSREEIDDAKRGAR